MTKASPLVLDTDGLIVALHQKFPLVADKTGVADASALLTAAQAITDHVRVPPGDYLIGSDLTILAGKTIEFDEGAVFNIGTGVIVIWNGGIKAGPYQKIFQGDLVQSTYTTNSLTPYVLALRGDPQIDYASPWWFGAVGDNATDDYDAIVSALYFGKVCYIPRLNTSAGQRYLCTTSLPVRQSGSHIYGDGYDSWLRLSAFTPSGVGQFIGMAGLLPTVSGGQPAAFVEDIVIEGLHIDTDDGVNDNGIGGNFAKSITVRHNFFSHVGRKAVTGQYHVHGWKVYGNRVISASTEVGSTHSVFAFEGENSGFNYANGVAGFDWDGEDNTGHFAEKNHVDESGYSGFTLSNARRCTIEGLTMDKLGALGRPVIVARVSKDNTFRSVKVKKSTRGFLNVTSSTTISTKFIDCWITDCSGDNMFYSEGPGSEFINCGGTQTDDRIVWSVRGADCKIIDCRGDATALGSTTQASSLFSTAARFEMRGSYLNSATGLRAFGGSTAPDIKILFNHFTGGITDGLNISGANFQAIGNTIGGNASNRVITAATAVNGVCTLNVLTGGASATINPHATSLFSSVFMNNPGDKGTSDNQFLGANAMWQDALGKLRIMTTGVLRTSDTDAASAIVGTQS